MKETKITPDNILYLKNNEVFVFGSNASGFHGAGAAGYAFRGMTDYNWRNDEFFIKAMNSSNPEDKIGKWAIYGNSQGFQEGKEGKSYAIKTILKPGLKRSISLDNIKEQIIAMLKFAKENPHLEFLVTPIGTKLAGYDETEISSCFIGMDIPNNVSLPSSFIEQLQKHLL